MYENWCADCRAKQKRLNAQPPLKTSGGWCAPNVITYAFHELGCYTYKARPMSYFLGVYGEGKVRKAYRKWKKDQKRDGLMTHAFVEPIQFPEIAVNRGGITYGPR